jgi:hypothetical protein
MSKQTTRRAVLAGTATLPALSLPALAADNPDAGLLALGREFDAANKREKQAWRTVEAALSGDIFDAAYKEADLLDSRTWEIAEKIFETQARAPQGLMLKVSVIDQLDIADDLDTMVSGCPISSLVEDVRALSGLMKD